ESAGGGIDMTSENAHGGDAPENRGGEDDRPRGDRSAVTPIDHSAVAARRCLDTTRVAERGDLYGPGRDAGLLNAEAARGDNGGVGDREVRRVGGAAQALCRDR